MVGSNGHQERKRVRCARNAGQSISARERHGAKLRYSPNKFCLQHGMVVRPLRSSADCGLLLLLGYALHVHAAWCPISLHHAPKLPTFPVSSMLLRTFIEHCAMARPASLQVRANFLSPGAEGLEQQRGCGGVLAFKIGGAVFSWFSGR